MRRWATTQRQRRALLTARTDVDAINARGGTRENVPIARQRASPHARRRQVDRRDGETGRQSRRKLAKRRDVRAPAEPAALWSPFPLSNAVCGRFASRVVEEGHSRGDMFTWLSYLLSTFLIMELGYGGIGCTIVRSGLAAAGEHCRCGVTAESSPCAKVVEDGGDGDGDGDGDGGYRYGTSRASPHSFSSVGRQTMESSWVAGVSRKDDSRAAASPDTLLNDGSLGLGSSGDSGRENGVLIWAFAMLPSTYSDRGVLLLEQSGQPVGHKAASTTTA